MFFSKRRHCKLSPERRGCLQASKQAAVLFNFNIFWHIVHICALCIIMCMKMLCTLQYMRHEIYNASIWPRCCCCCCWECRNMENRNIIYKWRAKMLCVSTFRYRIRSLFQYILNLLLRHFSFPLPEFHSHSHCVPISCCTLLSRAHCYFYLNYLKILARFYKLAVHSVHLSPRTDHRLSISLFYYYYYYYH